MGLFDAILSAFGMGGQPGDAPGSPTKAVKAGMGAASGTMEDGTTESMRAGNYTWDEADELSYDDYDKKKGRPKWISKRRNETVHADFRELHVSDLNKMKNGNARRLFAVYGVPVGWGISDAEVPEVRERIESIEAVREEGDNNAIQAIYHQWGFIDEEHYEWIREGLIPGYEQREAMQEKLDASSADVKQGLLNNAEVLKDELQPVEGVSMESWAAANAHLAQGGELTGVLAKLEVDESTWQAVTTEWNARMSRDTTTTIATIYGQAFTSAGVGQFGAAGQASAASMLDVDSNSVGGEEPIPFARWIEITEAQSAGVARGEDAAEILAGFGMTPADWATVGGWWSQRFAAEAMTRMEEYNQLSKRYRKQYTKED